MQPLRIHVIIFKPQTLEKSFYMDDPDEVIPRKFVGTEVGGGRPDRETTRSRDRWIWRSPDLAHGRGCARGPGRALCHGASLPPAGRAQTPTPLEHSPPPHTHTQPTPTHLPTYPPTHAPAHPPTPQIEWAAGKDTTVTVVKKRVQDKKGGKGRPAATISKTEPCDSFFNFFR